MAMSSENNLHRFPQPSRTTNVSSDMPHSRQLDFYQAMSDFKHMFPDMDEDVIEAVLRTNKGAVDATIDQLLTMNIDNENELGSSREINLRLFKNQSSGKDFKEEPPSYSEAVKSNPPPRPARTKGQSPQVDGTTQPNLIDIDIQSLSSTLSPHTDSKGVHKKKSKSHTHTSPRENIKKQYKPYKQYNPPLLGALPDDFLRLTPPKIPETQHSSLPVSPSYAPHNVPSTTKNTKSIQRQTVQRSSSLLSSPRITSKPHHLVQAGRSHSLVSRSNSIHQSVPNEWCNTELGNRPRIASSAKQRSLPHSPLSIQQGSKSPSRVNTITSHEINSEMLLRKMKENAWRRKSAPSFEEDPDMAQYLDDERMAIILQNREFLQELRDDKDFMAVLNEETNDETDSEKQVVTEKLPVSEKSMKIERVNTAPLPEIQQEGYGDDNQESLEAFPFTASAGQVDKDAELRHKLTHMGKDSKTHFASIAKKFFTIRRKKYQKSLLRDTVAPSTMNLLDEDYSNGDSTDGLQDDMGSSSLRSSHSLYRPRILTNEKDDSMVI